LGIPDKKKSQLYRPLGVFPNASDFIRKHNFMVLRIVMVIDLQAKNRVASVFQKIFQQTASNVEPDVEGAVIADIKAYDKVFLAPWSSKSSIARLTEGCPLAHSIKLTTYIITEFCFEAFAASPRLDFFCGTSNGEPSFCPHRFISFC